MLYRIGGTCSRGGAGPLVCWASVDQATNARTAERMISERLVPSFSARWSTASSLLQHFDDVSTFRFVGPLLDHLVGDRYAINGFHMTSVMRNTCLNVTETVVVSSAAYSLVRSILPICRIFSRVAASAMSSAMLSGTTCQETPQRSTHQPQRSASGTADSPVQ